MNISIYLWILCSNSLLATAPDVLLDVVVTVFAVVAVVVVVSTVDWDATGVTVSSAWPSRCLQSCCSDSISGCWFDPCSTFSTYIRWLQRDTSFSCCGGCCTCYHIIWSCCTQSWCRNLELLNWITSSHGCAEVGDTNLASSIGLSPAVHNGHSFIHQIEEKMEWGYLGKDTRAVSLFCITEVTVEVRGCVCEP